MAINYKLLIDAATSKETDAIKKTGDLGEVLFIPKNPDNIDYQEYLEWVAEGNTIEPADEE